MLLELAWWIFLDPSGIALCVSLVTDSNVEDTFFVK